ncbi:hypothetical protein BZG36_02925 [Bifiguratus adelaidae]|uniref:FAD-binding domain-containing protein n=1 Tax=Bifiguratus adelaidae TaxID=1938954 RepID=A0A261Y1D5_9FUNG|nr:hypothetical protein BZG36_02925 [Bifiguratus adelaidae]
MHLNTEETDIIVRGCGPTGAMLAGYLGTMNVRCIVLEREGEIVTDPRGIALDEDGIRLVQGLGFSLGDHHDLTKGAVMVMDYGTSEGGTGHVGFICHKQPGLEKYLRKKLAETKAVDFRPQSTIVGISEDDDHVYVEYKDKNGEIRGRRRW